MLLCWVNDTCFKLDSVNSTSYFYPQTAPPVIFPDSGNGNSVFPVSQAKNPMFIPASPVKSAFKASLLVTCTAESAWPLLWITEWLLTVLPALSFPSWSILRCYSTEPFAACRITPLPCSVAMLCPVQGRSPSYGLQPFFRNPRTRDISQLYHPLEWFHLRVFKTFLVWSTVPLSLYFKHTWSVTVMRSAIPSPILFCLPYPR